MGKQRSEAGADIKSVPTPWREIILVCRKCSKRVHGGFGKRGEHSLKHELREALRGEGRRRRDVRVMEVDCVGLCPKGAVTVSRTSHPGELLAVPRGADVDAVLARLTE